MHRTLQWAVGWLLATAVVAVAQSTSVQPASVPAATAPAATFEVNDAVARLGHPSFAVREQATQQLRQADVAIIDTLIEHYRRERSYENKLRLHHIIEHLYFRKLMMGEEGFLGIKLMPVEDIIDLATGRSSECVYVIEALQGMPAKKAGIEDGDIIIALDDRPVSWFFGAPLPPGAGQPGAPAVPAMNERVERFTWHVKRRRPGSPAKLKVLRCAEKPRQIKVAVAEEPAKTLDGATFVSVPATMIRSSPQALNRTKGGFLVTHVVAESAAAKVGLNPHDVVVSVDGTNIPVEADISLLNELLNQRRERKEVAMELMDIRELEYTVELGRRPVSLMNSADLAEARSSFATWWQEKTGEASTQREPADSVISHSGQTDVPPAPEASVVP